MSTLPNLEHDGDRQRVAANDACAAAQDLARAANGNNGHVIPGPVAYDLLGNIKVLLWHVKEVTEYLPTGLKASLNDPRIEVVDHWAGTPRDPAGQVAIAAEHLIALTACLADATGYAEAAQTALNSQGYEARS